MCPHRQEIELSDELLSRIDRASARTGHSRGRVVVDALRDHLAPEPSVTVAAIEERRARLKAFRDRIESLGVHRSQEDIDRDLRTIRSDRDHGR